MSTAAILDQALSAVCPIISVSIGTEDDAASWTYQPAPGATPVQIAAADTMMTGAPLIVAKGQQANLIRQAYADATDATVDYAGHTYQADVTSRGLLAAVVALAGAGQTMPDGFYWRSADNVNVPFGRTNIIELGQTMALKINTDFQKSIVLQAQIAACNTIADVQAINW